MTSPIDANNYNIVGNNSNTTDSVKGKTQTKDSDVTSTGQQARDGSKSVSSSDQVSLTPSVQKMQEIEKNLAELPEVDETRIAKFKQLIENNEYSVNADKVADKLIQMEKLIK